MDQGIVPPPMEKALPPPVERGLPPPPMERALPLHMERGLLPPPLDRGHLPPPPMDRSLLPPPMENLMPPPTTVPHLMEKGLPLLMDKPLPPTPMENVIPPPPVAEKSIPPPSAPVETVISPPMEKTLCQSPDNLFSQLRDLLNTGSLCDVKLICADGYVYLHKPILSAGSGMLAQIFRSSIESHEETYTVIILPEFTKIEIDQVVLFLYGGLETIDRRLGDYFGLSPQPFKPAKVEAKLEVQENDNSVFGNDSKGAFMMNVEPDYSWLEEDDADDFIDYDDDDLMEPRRKKKKKSRPRPGETFACYPCKLEFNTNFKEALRHVNDYHQDGDRYKCPICGKSIRFPRTFLSHVKVDCQNPVYKCNKCPKAFNLESSLINHARTHQNKKDEEQGKTFLCHPCQIRFDVYDDFWHHMNTHKDAAGLYKCPACKQNYWYAKNFSPHLQNNCIEPKFHCSKCPKSFTIKSALTNHERTHEEKADMVCPHCGKIFICKKGFDYHLRRHAQAYDFVCSWCEKKFLTKSKMNAHIKRMHTMERPHLCSDCGKGFVCNEKLREHIRRVHTGERPFACDQCDYRSVDTSGLAHHKKRHLQPGYQRRQSRQ